jgi:hypothetical protein
MSRHGWSGISQRSEILLETGGIYIAFILSQVITSQPITFSGVYPGYIIITTFMPFSNFKHFCIRSVVKPILAIAITLQALLI